MSLDNLNRWLTLAANLGVVAGIIFLGIEINQNQENIALQNTLSLVESRAASEDFFNGRRLWLLDHPDVFDAWIKGRNDLPLSESESIKYNLYCNYDIWGRFNVYARMSALDLNVEAAAVINGLAGVITDSNRDKECWNGIKNQILRRGYSDFVNSVDEIIASN